MLAFIRIVGLGIVAAVVYGILHDQITARISIEYFTIGHPRLVAGDSPTLHGLAWGVIATWWMGAILGIGLAIASRLGRWPRLDWRDMRRPVIAVLLIMGLLALIAGIAGWLAFEPLKLRLFGRPYEEIPPERHARFFAAWCSHSVSYLVGALGGAGLWFWAVIERGRRAVRAAGERTGETAGTAPKASLSSGNE